MSSSFNIERNIERNLEKEKREEIKREREKKEKKEKKREKKRRKKKGENNISFFKTRLVYCLDGWKAVFCPQRNNNQGRKTND